MEFESADTLTTYDYSFDPNSATNRLLKADVWELPYWGGENSFIYLRNEDHAVQDLRGYHIDIGWGNYTTSNEYSTQARVWVESQRYSTSPGKQYVALKMLTMYDILNMIPYTGGSAPDYKYTYTSTTVYDILEDLIETYTPFTLDAIGSVDDGIITTLEPTFVVNDMGVQYWESIGQAVYRLLGITKLYLKAKTGLAFELVYPQEADAVDETYEAPLEPVTGKHAFYSYTENYSLVLPNSVKVFGNQSSDGTWGSVVTGEWDDTGEQSRFMTIADFYPFGSLTAEADLDNQASAHGARELAEMKSGVGIIPHDCRIELYDKPVFLDGR